MTVGEAMFEKIKYIGPMIVASSLLFGFFFYVGMRLRNGDTLRGSRGFMRLIADGLNWLADLFGNELAGYGIMTLSLFLGVFAAVLLRRES